MYVFGGDDGFTFFQNMFALNLETLEWRKIEPKHTILEDGSKVHVFPKGRSGATLVPFDNRLFLFGGDNNNEAEKQFNDLYYYDSIENVWIKPAVSGTPPRPREGHSAVSLIDPSSNNKKQMLVFGGHCCQSKDVYFSDIHVLDVNTMAWSTLSNDSRDLTDKTFEGILSYPLERTNHSAAILEGQNKMVVFGGRRGKRCFSDIYVLDLNNLKWFEPLTTGQQPTPREGCTMDCIGQKLIIFGGNQQWPVYYNDTYVCDIGNL